MNPDFLSHLKALNVQAVDWLKRHIEENPLVILSPVFEDYEQHLKEITEKFPPAQLTAPASSSFVPAALKSTGEGEKSGATPFAFGLAAKANDGPPASSGFKAG
jgi:hypothetical protein